MALSDSLFAEEWQNITVARTIPKTRGEAGVVLMFYHKTGNRFCWGLSKRLKGALGLSITQHQNGGLERHFGHGENYMDFWSAPIEGPQGHNLARVHNPSRHFPLPEGTRGVHFYRDLVSTVLSGYRYHSDYDSAEMWEHHMNRCFMCDALGSTVFEACSYQCGYYQLLLSTSEQRGVALEAMRARRQLEEMAANLGRWANDPEVLHLSIEHLRLDFNKTVGCLLAFLGHGARPDLVERLQDLDLGRRDDPNAPHVTYDKNDNHALRAFLEEQRHWTPQFHRARRLAMAVFRRQGRLYGCPVPNLWRAGGDAERGAGGGRPEESEPGQYRDLPPL